MSGQRYIFILVLPNKKAEKLNKSSSLMICNKKPLTYLMTHQGRGILYNISYNRLALIVFTICFTFSSVTQGPVGKHIPTLNRLSLTPLT